MGNEEAIPQTDDESGIESTYYSDLWARMNSPETKVFVEMVRAKTVEKFPDDDE